MGKTNQFEELDTSTFEENDALYGFSRQKEGKLTRFYSNIFVVKR